MRQCSEAPLESAFHAVVRKRCQLATLPVQQLLGRRWTCKLGRRASEHAVELRPLQRLRELLRAPQFDFSDLQAGKQQQSPRAASAVRSSLDFLLAPARLGLPGSVCSLPGLDFGRTDTGSHGERRVVTFLKTVLRFSYQAG